MRILKRFRTIAINYMTKMFTLHRDSVQAKQYVGLIQLKSGRVIEILPKISSGETNRDKKHF